MSASGGPASVRHRRARFARERFGPHLPESSGGRTSGCRRGALVSTPWRTAFARDARPQRAVESTGSRSLSRRACWTVSPIGGSTTVFGNRLSANAMSAIGTQGRIHAAVFIESFTAEVMCRFPDRLAGHKVHLVVGGHSAHRSRKVREWLTRRPPDDVDSHFLAPLLAGAWCRGVGQPRTAASCADAGVSRTSSAATAAARTSATSWTGTP